jgi:Protein of unknown function (DUF2630)
MDDKEILAQINKLAEEEQRLEEGHVGDGLSEDEHARLHAIEVTLDQLWDVLRQRRAKRNAGGDPDVASERSEGVVEGYLQ